MLGCIETCVRDEVSRYGQHWMEVIRMGQRVEVEGWMEHVPQAARHLAQTFQRKEPGGLGVWRMYLWWPAREMVRIEGFGDGMLWKIEAGQTIRSAAANAAAQWWVEKERWPGRCLVEHLPAGAPGAVALEDEPGVELALEESAWVPKGYVLVA